MIIVRYFAAARDAAGCGEDSFGPPAGGTLTGLLLAAQQRHGGPDGDLARVLARCAFLLDGQRAGPDTNVPAACVVDVLPPFAGG